MIFYYKITKGEHENSCENVMENNLEFVKGYDKIYVVDSNGEEIAEVDYPEVEDNVFEITHTYVSDDYRGMGIAGKLVKMAYLDIKDRGGRAVPKCTYAQVWMENHVDSETGELLDEND